jgi:hypothetical protein
MKIQDLFVRSNEELARVVDQISDEHWDLPLPEGMSTKPSTLLQAVNYHTYDDAWVPDVLAGKTTDQVGDQYEALLTSDRHNARAVFAQYNARAGNAARSFDDVECTVHLSYGDFPAHEYFRHIIAFRAFRAHDIARMIGVEAKLPGDVVDGLWVHLAPYVEGYRAMGVFPPARDVSADADSQTQLLALVGRE